LQGNKENIRMVHLSEKSRLDLPFSKGGQGEFIKPPDFSQGENLPGDEKCRFGEKGIS
jgi:hypothetical protein